MSDLDRLVAARRAWLRHVPAARHPGVLARLDQEAAITRSAMEWMGIPVNRQGLERFLVGLVDVRAGCEPDEFGWALGGVAQLAIEVDVADADQAETKEAG